MRVYQRKFDWDEAQRLYQENVPIAWIAAKLRVTPQAVLRVVRPEVRQRMADYHRELYIGKDTCKECGAATNLLASKHGLGLCQTCAAKRRRFSVRETELHCSDCDRWLPDDQFHHSNDKRSVSRRGRRGICKTCDVRRRKIYRDAHRTQCKGGCGRMVSIGDQEANLRHPRSRGRKRQTIVGYCRACSRQIIKQLKEPDPIQDGAAAFRKKFGTPADRADTTSNE